MANLKLLYRSEAAGGVESAAGKTLQLGRERGLLLVLSQEAGVLQNGVAHQLAIATIEQCFKPEILTEKMLANPLQQLTRTEKCIADAFRQYRKAQPQTKDIDAQVAMAWIKDGQYYVSGSLRVVCFNPKLGLRSMVAGEKPSAMPMYDGDLLLISTSDRYEAMDDEALVEALSSQPDNLSVCYKTLAQAKATLMALVIGGAATPEKPAEQENSTSEKIEEEQLEKNQAEPVKDDEPLVPIHTKSGHYETHDDAPITPIRGEVFWIIAAAMMTITIIVLFCFF